MIFHGGAHDQTSGAGIQVELRFSMLYDAHAKCTQASLLMNSLCKYVQHHYPLHVIIFM